MKRERPVTIREKLSLTQQNFAEYLSGSRTQLFFYEKGLRKLPLDPALKLAELELILHRLQQSKIKQAPAYLHPLLQRHREKTKNAMQNKAKSCSYHKLLAQRELDKMTAEHKKASLLLRLLDKLAPAVLKKGNNNKDHLWVMIQKEEAIRKMIRYGEAAQANMQAKIRSLEIEAAAYKMLHKSF
jgi:DNA-binding XRE family transcriptional regulator